MSFCHLSVLGVCYALQLVEMMKKINHYLDNPRDSDGTCVHVHVCAVSSPPKFNNVFFSIDWTS